MTKSRETPNKEAETQNIMSMLAQSTPIDLRSGFELAARRQANRMTTEDLEKQDDFERVEAEKLAQVEKSRAPINFFNVPTLKLMSKSK